jgi:predicted DNA-binding transcriptional regulator YafY
MTNNDRRKLQQAIANQQTATVRYNAPLRGGIVTRHVRGYELSANRSGRPVLWGSDSLHGARRLHSFRLDRIVGVQISDRAKAFDKAVSISRDLVHEGAATPATAPSVPPRAHGRPTIRRAAPAPPAAPYRPRVFISVDFGGPARRR